MSTTVETPVEYERKPLPPTPVSFEQFMAWTDEDTHAEWVDGEIVLMSPSGSSGLIYVMGIVGVS